MMAAQLGPDVAGPLVASLDGLPAVGVRMNPSKHPLSSGWPQGEPVEWCRDGFRIPDRPVFALDPAWHAGAYYVQEPASMMEQWIVERISGPEPVRVADLCAAPGGKTTAALAALPAGSMMLANEFVPSRAAVLAENLQKWGSPDVIVTQGDTAALTSLGPVFDLVIADAPCSGEGMMRKEEEARSQWSEGLVSKCALLQREIAANGAALLRDGGFMVYSTCTFNRTENEENVEWICHELGFEPALPALPDAWPLVRSELGLRFYPYLTGSEGLFISVLKKRGVVAPLTSKKKNRRGVRAPFRLAKSADAPWVDMDADHVIMEYNGSLWALKESAVSVIGTLARSTRILCAGTEVAIPGKRGYDPAHAVAMSPLLRRGYFPELELDRKLALRYLARRTDGMLIPPGFPAGPVLASFDGLPLGWLRNVGSRLNNLYPKNWKLRLSIE